MKKVSESRIADQVKTSALHIFKGELHEGGITAYRDELHSYKEYVIGVSWRILPTPLNTYIWLRMRNVTIPLIKITRKRSMKNIEDRWKFELCVFELDVEVVWKIICCRKMRNWGFKMWKTTSFSMLSLKIWERSEVRCTKVILIMQANCWLEGCLLKWKKHWRMEISA